MKLKRIRFGERMSAVDIAEGHTVSFGCGAETVSVSFTNTMTQRNEHFRVEFSYEEWEKLVDDIVKMRLRSKL